MGRAASSKTIFWFQRRSLRLDTRCGQISRDIIDLEACAGQTILTYPAARRRTLLISPNRAFLLDIAWLALGAGLHMGIVAAGVFLGRIVGGDPDMSGSKSATLAHEAAFLHQHHRTWG